MKYAALILLFAFIACKNTETPATIAPAPPAKATAVEKRSPEEASRFSWEKQEHNFGDISASEKVSHTFRFTNTGKVPMMISDASGSCGCTVPDYPKNPIAPGAGGEITVTFDPANKQGMTSKIVTLRANTESGIERIVIKANIIP